MSIKKAILAVLAATVSLSTFASGAQAATVFSEDFSNASVPGWTLSGTAVVDTGISGFGNALAFDLGNQNSTSALSPAIAVVQGAVYTLTLQFASEGGCSYSGDCSGAHILTPYVNGNWLNGGIWFGSYIAIYGHPPPPGDQYPLSAATFLTSSVTFTAPTSSIYLTFTDTTPYPSNLGAYGILDNVTLTGAAPVSATPLPSALPLFAGGLGALGLLGWRRKRKTQGA